MADVTPILINGLASQSTLSDSDYFIVGGADAKKISVAQMKEALGINELNGNMIENTIVHSVDFATINAGGALNPGIYCGEITGTPNDSGQPILITDVYQVSSIGTIRIQHLYNVGLDEFHIRTKFNDFDWTEWHQIY